MRVCACLHSIEKKKKLLNKWKHGAKIIVSTENEHLQEQNLIYISTFFLCALRNNLRKVEFA
jgi:hypothetical protein